MPAQLRKIIVFALILTSFQAFSKESHQCKKALKKMGICLALQSDFYDRVDLANTYSDSSECIEGVNFFDGIEAEDAKAMTKLYDLRIQTKEDPLNRKDRDGIFGKSTSYCAGEITLKVADEMKNVSLVFTVANYSRKSKSPEIKIEL